MPTEATIKTYLEILQWTQAKMARELGVTPQRIQQWINQDHPVPDIYFRYLRLYCVHHRFVRGS